MSSDSNSKSYMPIESISIGTRHRKDMGGIQALAENIARIGLLHPVVVTPDGRLIAGARRLEALRLLGWTEVPVRIVNLEHLIEGEWAENVMRKDFTPSEAVAIGEALEPIERERARQREIAGKKVQPSGNFPEGPGRAMDRVAAAVGLSRKTYTRAKAVVEAAREDPETFGQIAEQMDSTGNVNRAYQSLQRIKNIQAQTAIPESLPPADQRWQLLHGDFREIMPRLTTPIDVIITDPPYPREFLPLYGDLARLAANILPEGGSLLVMCGQSYLPEVMAQLSIHVTYHWMLAYLTPGASLHLWQRNVNTLWKPVLWFVKGQYTGPIVADVARSGGRDKRFHDWEQSESGMADLIQRFTLPGQTILDPFCGSGTTGVAALRMNRLFVGIDVDKSALETARGRLMHV